MSATTIHTYTIVFEHGEVQTFASLDLAKLTSKVNEFVRSSEQIKNFLKALARAAGTSTGVRALAKRVLSGESEVSFDELAQLKEADTDDLAHIFGNLEGWGYAACQED